MGQPAFCTLCTGLTSCRRGQSTAIAGTPKTPEDFLWAVENACKSASCGVVLAWPFANKLKPQASRRIQIMAKQGQTLACLFQPLTNRHTNSMAELRLALHPDKNTDQLILDICKRRGGWPINI